MVAPNPKIPISIIWRDPVEDPNVKMHARCVSSMYILQGLGILCRETQRRFLWRCGRRPNWGQRSWLLLCAWDGVGGACGATVGVLMGGTHLTPVGVQIGSNGRGSSNSGMESWRSVIVLESLKMGVLDVVRIEWCWRMIRILQVPSSGVLSVGPQRKRRVSGSCSTRGKRIWPM